MAVTLAKIRRTTSHCRLAVVSVGLLLAAVATASGQRVQIPAQSPGTFGAAAGNSFQSPAVPFGPPAATQGGFGGQAFGAPAAPVIGPPPAFDPYASGGLAPPATAPLSGPFVGSPQIAPAPTYSGGATFGAPQATFGQPQGFAQQPAFTQPQGSVYPSGLPVGWEPGSYSFEGDGGGTMVKFTKFLQKLDGEYTHLFGGNAGDDLQLNRVEVSSTFAWPIFGNIDTPVLLTPGFVYNDFSDSILEPFPGEVYEAYLDASWFPQINESIGAELGFRTGVWTDFEEVNSDSVRYLGRGLAVVRLTPTLQVLAGVVYLDRRRIKLLPAGGVRWRPTPDVEVNAVFPNPLVRRRLRTAGVTDWWIFVAGEYGGGSWTHELAPAMQGFDYNDLRVSLGLQFETQSKVSGSFEVGYVFDREFYFSGAGLVPEFDDTLMLRAGINL